MKRSGRRTGQGVVWVAGNSLPMPVRTVVSMTKLLWASATPRRSGSVTDEETLQEGTGCCGG